MRTSPKAMILAALSTMALAASLTPASALMTAAESPIDAVVADDSHDNGDLPDSRNSDNLELVALINPGGSGGGTDIEFYSRELERWKDADGAWVEETATRHFALVGNQRTGAQTYDITDPEHPYLLHVLSECRVGQGDTQTSADGMFALIASQSGSCTLASGQTVSSGSIIVDLTDPYKPTPISIASGSAHNNTLHPSGDYIYISSSSLAPNSGANSRIPIYDITDRTNPVKVTDFMIPANGPHDIRFNADGTRAYTAGISAFHILDTTDPEDPSIISTIVPPGGSIGHDTLISPEGRFLFLGDEGGGGAPYPCPGGAVHVYDLTVEAAPLYLGQVFAGGGPVTNRHVAEPAAGGVGACTSHVMELNPDGKSFTLGWYTLGFRIFDFSSFYNADGTPKAAAGIAAAWGQYGTGLVETGYMVVDGANTWSAKQYDQVPGYVFADDLVHGFHVSKILD